MSFKHKYDLFLTELTSTVFTPKSEINKYSRILYINIYMR